MLSGNLQAIQDKWSENSGSFSSACHLRLKGLCHKVVEMPMTKNFCTPHFNYKCMSGSHWRLTKEAAILQQLSLWSCIFSHLCSPWQWLWPGSQHSYNEGTFQCRRFSGRSKSCVASQLLCLRLWGLPAIIRPWLEVGSFSFSFPEPRAPHSEAARHHVSCQGPKHHLPSTPGTLVLTLSRLEMHLLCKGRCQRLNFLPT